MPGQIDYAALYANRERISVRQTTLLQHTRRHLPAFAITIGVVGLFALATILAVADSTTLRVLAVPAYVISMSWAWYLGHDCAHLSALHGRAANYRLGSFLAWFCGAAYFAFADYARDHLRHHSDHVDLVDFSLVQFRRKNPRVVRRFLLPLERVYIPSVHYLVKLAAVAGALKTGLPSERTRIWLALIINSAYAAGLAYSSVVFDS